mgnify:CR=1 FL=1
MYKCDICGREIFKKNCLGGYVLCSKHMHQYFKYGFFLDNIQRTNSDLNEYHIKGNYVEFDVYNQRNIKVNSFIIDIEDIELVKYHKWRADTNNHIITGNCTSSSPRKELTHVILEVPDGMVVDHINGNALDNRKSNLRICTQHENIFNKSYMSNNHSGFQGVSWDKSRRRWAPEIRFNGSRCHLGRYKNKEDAIFVRDLAERICFREFQNQNKSDVKKEMFKNIPEERKIELITYTTNKLNKTFGDKLCRSPKYAA